MKPKGSQPNVNFMVCSLWCIVFFLAMNIGWLHHQGLRWFCAYWKSACWKWQWYGMIMQGVVSVWQAACVSFFCKDMMFFVFNFAFLVLQSTKKSTKTRVTAEKNNKQPQVIPPKVSQKTTSLTTKTITQNTMHTTHISKNNTRHTTKKISHKKHKSYRKKNTKKNKSHQENNRTKTQAIPEKNTTKTQIIAE